MDVMSRAASSSALARAVALALLLALGVVSQVAAGPAKPQAPRSAPGKPGTRQLKRSDAFKRLGEVAAAEIKANTKAFLQERGKVSTRHEKLIVQAVI